MYNPRTCEGAVIPQVIRHPARSRCPGREMRTSEAVGVHHQKEVTTPEWVSALKVPTSSEICNTPTSA